MVDKGLQQCLANEDMPMVKLDNCLVQRESMGDKTLWGATGVGCGFDFSNLEGPILSKSNSGCGKKIFNGRVKSCVPIKVY